MIVLPIIAATLLVVGTALAHDIPNARVDRTIQASLEPGWLRVDYAVSLSELTLTQDLRRLIEELPGADRQGWFQEYGRVTGPLNAKGLLVAVDGIDRELRSIGFDLILESHPRYTFHFEVTVPATGRLSIIDTNYVASEGTSRLALRPAHNLTISGDTLPTEVSQIPPRPVWQLSDMEERRTRRLTVDYTSSKSPNPVRPQAIIVQPVTSQQAKPVKGSLTRLLDDTGSRAWWGLLLAAFLLGMAHAIQPGHGKTIVAAASLGPGHGVFRGALLGLLTAMAHMASVAAMAGILWASRSTRPAELHLVLARGSGFVIAAIGLWKLGRHLAGWGADHLDLGHPTQPARRLIPLALAGGVVPCWDAVALVILSEVIGRLTLGLALLAAFSLGMASVLVSVGVVASRFRLIGAKSGRRGLWERRLGLVGGLILAMIGLSLMRI